MPKDKKEDKSQPAGNVEDLTKTQNQPLEKDSLLGRVVDTDSYTGSGDNVLNKPDQLPVKKKGVSKPKIVTLVVGGLLLVVVLGLLSVLVKTIPQIPRMLGKKGEIVWWGIKEDSEVVKEIIEEYQKNNPDVRITYLKQSEEDYADRLFNSLSKGQGPDIFEIHNSWIPDFRKHLDSLPSEIMTSQEYKDTFLPVIASTLQNNGNIVGFSTNYDGLTLYVNESIFSVARKSYPQTWDDVSSLSSNQNGLTLNVGNSFIQSAVAMGSVNNVKYWQDIVVLLMVQNLVNPANPVGTRANDVVSYYQKFIKSTNWNEAYPESVTAFSQGKVAMLFAKAEDAPKILGANPELKFKTIPLPQLPKNSTNDPDYAYASFWFNGVWARSTNNNTVWDFLKFLTSRESIEKMNETRKLLRAFAMPSSRIDMISDYEEDVVLGPMVKDGLSAKSWYLAGDAKDGDSGINHQMTAIYQAIVERGKIFDTDIPAIQKVLAQFGVGVR